MSSEFETHVMNGATAVKTDVSPNSERRRRLEARANVVRARLLQRVDVLRTKARELRDPSADVRKHPIAAAVAVGALGVLVGVGGEVLVSRITHRRERAHRAMWGAFMPVFRQPVQLIQVQKGIFARSVEQGVVGVLVAALTTATKAYVGKLFEKELPKKARYYLASPDPFPATPHK